MEAVDFRVHVRYEGNSYEFGSAQLDLGNLSTDADIRQALEKQLGANLAHYVVDREQNGNVTVRPQAVFG